MDTGISVLISPPDGFRGELARRGIKVKNHIRENKESLKDIEQVLKEYKSIPDSPIKLPKMKRFNNVQSRVNSRTKVWNKTCEVKNFIKDNKEKNLRSSFSKLPEEEGYRGKSQGYGTVPSYIYQIKEELRERKERERIAEEESKWPAGMRLIPEEEKKRRIADLLSERETGIQNLMKFTFSADSNVVKERKRNIEERLSCIEFELRRLSLSTVYEPK